MEQVEFSADPLTWTQIEMTRDAQRKDEVSRCVQAIRAALASGPTVESLTAAKSHLCRLAENTDLFTFDDFPLPDDGSMENSYLLHQFDDGSYALYVNAGAPHQYYAPHDHGAAWAVIAGVRGAERHKMYKRTGSSPEERGSIELAAEIVVEPGTAVTMMPDGIHEVSIENGEPVLHLHLYAKSFELQEDKWTFDPDSGSMEQFQLDSLGPIFDRR